MASISIVDLLAALENHVGKEALLSAIAVYSNPLPASPTQKVAVPPVPGAPVKARKPQSEETKAAAALKRAATKAAKAIAEAGAEAVLAPALVPVPVTGAAPEKPKKVLSEEQKAKMKAGREAAKAKKAAEAAAGSAPAPAPEPAPEADGAASDTSSQKRRGPKKLSEMTPEERAAHDKKVAERKAAKAAPAPAPATAPAPSPPAEDHTVFAPFTHKGVKYLRNMRGDLLTPEYEWVGRYDSAKKSIDTAFPKPADLDDE